MNRKSLIWLCSAVALTAITAPAASAQSGFSITLGSGGYGNQSSRYDGYNDYRRQGFNDQYRGWNNGGDTYAEFQQEAQHIERVIQHGLRDGTIPRFKAKQFYRELQSIRRAAYIDAQRGGFEGDYVQARLERLDAWVDATHDRNHDRRDENY